MNQFDLKRFCNYGWLGLVTFFVCLVLSAVEARGSTSFLTTDVTTREYATSYEVVEVREAIANCRKGKFPLGLSILKQYSQEEDIAATYVLANLHYYGIGVEKAESLAIKMLGRNVAEDHYPSMIRLGEIKEEQSPAEAMQLYKRASAGNDGAANLKLGGIFEKGLLGNRANPKLAFKYYNKAHEGKDVMGTFHVARCYDTGVGVSPNAIESTRLFREAAMSGAGLANAVMARRYYEGKGVEADPVAAVGWLTRGTQAGSTEAMVLLGQRYEAGDVLGKDIRRAGQLYSNAARLNDPVGRYHLALLYLNGTGTRPDPVRAYVLLDGAKGYPKAVEQLESLSKTLSEEQLAAAREQIEAMAKKLKK